MDSEAVPKRPSRKFSDRARAVAAKVAGYFAHRDPTVRDAFGPALVVSMLLFLRSPASNYIFDEQEALLANPFVNGKVPFRDILSRDFWGLPHDRSIGSYRPLPNLVWRALWQLGPVFQHPWTLHFVNILVHALNAACVARIAFGLTRQRSASWLAGAAFVTFAVLTEAVTGVVGIADVFGALGLLLAVLALEKSLPTMTVAVFASVSLGLFSKESTLVALPIVAWVALVAAPIHHRERPLRVARSLAAFVAAALALVLYAETRRHFFPSEPPAALGPGGQASRIARGFHAFLKWFDQPKLPQDPVNNPFILADLPHRVAGALRVYASGVGQVFLPLTLSGDYSYAAEPVPTRLFTARSIAGGLLLLGPPLVGVGAWLSALVSEYRGVLGGARTRLIVAIACVWAPVAYFPHSNIPVTLPTVRAERFWYLPAVGVALALGVLFANLVRRSRFFGVPRGGLAVVTAFLCFQATRARMHACDYSNDLVFWRATARAAPRSAKAHLNYGVMLGARGELEPRLVENRLAMEIAPSWPMAHVYYADTLCRLNRTDEAWPHYLTGIRLAPNDRNLIALSLQCLWEHHAIESRAQELMDEADEHPGTWLSYLFRDIVANGKENGGVPKKYRPRAYDEGPSE